MIILQVNPKVNITKEVFFFLFRRVKAVVMEGFKLAAWFAFGFAQVVDFGQQVGAALFTEEVGYDLFVSLSFIVTDACGPA